MTGSREAEDVGHRIEPGRTPHDEPGGAQRAARVRVAIVGLVHEPESLTQRAERHRVLADDVPGAEGVDADLLLRALAREPLPAVTGHLAEIPPERPGDGPRHAQRGAARRVFLE